MSFLRSQDPLDYRKSKIIPEKKSTSASLTMWMPWLHGTQQTGKFFKRWEYQTTLLASWEICTQVRKQQLEPDIEQQTGPNWERSTKGRIASPCYLTYIPSSVQSLSHVQFFVTPWTAACQASTSITNSRSLLKLMSIKSVIPSAISSSVFPFSSCLQSFPASGSSPMSRLHIRANVLEFQLQSFQWIFRTDFF